MANCINISYLFSPESIADELKGISNYPKIGETIFTTIFRVLMIFLSWFAFIVEHSFGMEEPKDNIYPVVSHSVGGIGDAAYIWTPNGTFWVTYQFDDSLDRILYESLSWEIKSAPGTLHSLGEAELPPTVYFVGVFETKQDPRYKRPTLRVRKWFAIPPFYKLNSPLTVCCDFKKCQVKRGLDLSDFQIAAPHKEKTKDTDISKFVRFHNGVKPDPRLFAYPVLGINMKDMKITTLTESYPSAVLCSKFKLMNERNAISQMEGNTQIKNCGIKTWFLGFYDNKQKLFYVYDFFHSDSLLPPSANSSASTMNEE